MLYKAYNTGSIALGCMRIHDLPLTELERLVKTALDRGINLFDHADIYGGGKCELQFGDLFKQDLGLRERVILQTKCGIRPGWYDASKEYIIASCEASLQRLNTDFLDLFILHRPDTLMDPHEVAEAFTILQTSGKVRHFGVSNMNAMQVDLLKTAVQQPLLVNQLQFGLKHSELVDTGLQANTQFPGSIDRSGHILEYSRIHNMTIQAWSPLQYGFFEGNFVGNDKFPELNALLTQLAKEHDCSPTAIAIAWILMHPARMQAIVGTTKPTHLEELAEACDITLTREQWYRLYRAAGNMLP